MNQNQRTLMDLILAAINEDYANFTADKSLNIEALYEEAISHRIHTLIYPVLRKYSNDTGLWASFIQNRRQDFLKDIALQETHGNQMSTVLKEFYSNHIPVIILKGLVLRDYYPDPALRLMGDGDILVKPEDVETAKILLQSLGYKAGKSTLRHTGFQYEAYPEIELHTLLTNSEIGLAGETFTDTVWDHALPAFFLNAPVLKLSIYDQIIHLFLHAGQHMCSGGFGLRQLCDIVLFLQVHMEEINLEHLFTITAKYQIHRFSLALLAVCEKLFHLNLPTVRLKELDETFIDLFIADIFAAGVYGRKTNERANSTRLIKYMDTNNTQGKLGQIKYWISFLFPTSNIIKNNYHYVIKHPYLLPAAWIHRMARNLGKLFTFRIDTGVKNINENRFKLLLWLQLR